ncbi:heparinase II/III family protein [Halorhodospira halochloris]|uniref:heparinase II/III family protein n=1 Tax=Halorhodospira halochloris TaxID=1052 RepID=UPI001EE7CD88|nr:heparinase II/III family protein [Halorhodospira halochloris]MCG5548919.1 heparinase II/III family protein [Halorhodospira halochloris]
MPSLQRARLYFHTIRHLRPGQIGWRLWYRLYRPRIPSQPAPPVRDARGPWIPPLPREQSLLDPQTACFLNQRAPIDDPGIWNDARYDKLWLYNLHYFDDLNARGAVERNAWHRELIERWIAENPPGYGNGWEPYPTSLRIVNWVKWLQAGNTPTAQMLDSLATQARWLRRRLEYHILGNHLLANAKALCFAGLFFSGPEADRWYRKGLAILRRELPEQILPDGGHFERSPMYHLLVLEDLLDLINLHRHYEAEIPQQWHDAVAAMLQWSAVMRHPDGEIPFFNDAAFGIAPHPADLDQYASWLKLTPPSPPGTKWDMWHGAASGYARLSNEQATVFTDIAPIGPDYLPGHAHADTLSFEMSLGGERVFVNGGTSRYGHGSDREQQRSTRSHNTVSINGADSSEVWSGFRVARRARPFNVDIRESGDSLYAAGAHNGYRRLAGHPIHRRTWDLSQGQLTITDLVGGSGQHTIEAYLLLAPGHSAEPDPSDSSLRIQTARGQQLRLAIQASHEHTLEVEEADWHPRFGVQQPTQRLRLITEARLPVTLTTRISW